MTKLQVYSPFRDIWNLSDEFGRLFWNMSSFRPEEGETASEWAPAVDVYEDNEALKIHADLPGLKKEEVKIKIDGGILTLTGDRRFEKEEKKDNYYRLERRYGTFARSFTLPNTVDAEKVHAKMKDGVLEILIPKKPEAKAKEVRVDIT